MHTVMLGAALLASAAGLVSASAAAARDVGSPSVLHSGPSSLQQQDAAFTGGVANSAHASCVYLQNGAVLRVSIGSEPC
jgi:hypothetical protein